MKTQRSDPPGGVSHWVSSQGVNLHVTEHAGSTPDSQVLLLVHGHRAHLGWWDDLIPSLTTRYRVFAMDFSGMGDSDFRHIDGGSCGYSQAGHVQDLQNIADFAVARAQQPLHAIIAHSWGGQIALLAASQNPHIASQLLILDSYSVLPGETCDLRPIPVGNRRPYDAVDTAATAFRLSPAQHLEPELLRALAHKSMREVEGGWAWKFDPDLEPVVPLVLADVAARLTLPVGIIYGSLSTIVSAERAKRIVNTLPQGRGPYAVVGAHHHLMLDHPQATADVILNLLAESLNTV